MQTFWILVVPVLFTAALVWASIALGEYLRIPPEGGVKPGTIIEVGRGHGYTRFHKVKIDGVFYSIAEIDSTSITVGKRVA